MEEKKERLDKIEKALFKAHREQRTPDLPPEWRKDVMRHIRRLHTEGQAADRRPPATLVFQRMILPFATATGLVAVAFLAYLLTAVPGMEQDLLAVFTQDPSGMLATQALGL